ncbi:DUF3311 domain-containing protein [Halosolutus gelatinilyticus]|uniref:DUF3311 domain-containing protein n=1 Tax=Halosolutus gelatinilyticus TaxID=2931975 RepID=UPI001FF2BDF4|nr:DUF3311 domain-containing protein [Halosolutus gelatinilyticus]
MRRLQLRGWIAIGLVLCGLAIPWFLWADATVIAGLPLWLWWHVGWMLLASLVFWTFARRSWGIGIETDNAGASDSSPGGTPDAAGGESP